MKRGRFILISLLALSFSFMSCSEKVKEQNDKVYSRHLQRQVNLTIINTPTPNDKADFNLLLLNDGQDIGALHLKEIIAQLYKEKKIQPLVVVGIHAGDRNREYGVAGSPDFMHRGDKAEQYSNFIYNELYAYIKKKAGVRKFRSVVMAGASLGGLSALDIAWNHADKIDKAAVFSGALWWRDKDSSDPAYSDDKDRIIFNMIRSSRKRPKLGYWFYAGGQEEISDRDKDGIIDVVDDTRDMVDLIRQKKVCPPGDVVLTEYPEGKHDINSWSKVMPEFLTWAFGY